MALLDLELKYSISRGRALTARRLEKGWPRSLWGASPALTLPLKARADRLLGFDSETLVFNTHNIPGHFDWNMQTLVHRVQRFAPGFLPVLDRLILAWVLRRYDVVHLFYDRGITTPIGCVGISLWELDVLQRANKAVYLFARGPDVRTREATLALGRWNVCVECPEPGKYCVCTKQEGERISATAAHATDAVAMADLDIYTTFALQFDYWPINTALMEPVAGDGHVAPGPLRIVHASSHAHFGGTRHLIATVDALRAEGHEIELILLQSSPGKTAVDEFVKADLVVDQLVGGAYEYPALEAMACGKPVLSYIRDPSRIEASLMSARS